MTPNGIVAIRDLRIIDNAGRPVVDGLSLTLSRQGTLGIVGESGSGKTTTALAMLGAVRTGLRLTGGSVDVAGTSMLVAPGRIVRRVRRSILAYLGQDPASALNPILRVREQLTDVTQRSRATPEEIGSRLSAVGLPSDRGFQRRYPHQLSGGQQQRLALARALANDPQLVILDEPTTGLDVVTQDLVLDELSRQRSRLGFAMVVVSHDLAVVARLVDTVMVMRYGRIVEEGHVLDVLRSPTTAYARTLLGAYLDPSGVAAIPESHPERATALHISGLCAAHGGSSTTVVAAEDISFSVNAGECVALLGPSGSGKSTIARCLAGLHQPDRGEVSLLGAQLAAVASQRTPAQRGAIQLIPQDPYGSLNPRRRVGDAVARPLEVLHGMDRDTARAEVAVLLQRVRLPTAIASRYPSELSGGERQRIAIARALAARPLVLICDEITSSLDVAVQSEILDLLTELRAKFGLAVVLITHDLGVVARVAERVLVLDRGVVCEEGRLDKVLSHPSHELTRHLLAAASSLNGSLDTRQAQRDNRPGGWAGDTTGEPLVYPQHPHPDVHSPA